MKNIFILLMFIPVTLFANELDSYQEQLRLQRDAIEELQRANQQREQAERIRANQEEMRRAQQETWDANKKKIENDWKGY